MNGFTIQCTKCGNAAVFTQETNEPDGYEFIQSSNDTLTMQTSGGYGYYGTSCEKCGNEIEAEY